MFVNEKRLMWGSEGVAPSRRKHMKVGGRASSSGQFLRFFNQNYVLLGIFGLKFSASKHILTIAAKL